MHDRPKVIIWGFGLFGQSLYKILSQRGISIEAVIDRRESRVHQPVSEILNIPTDTQDRIHHPDDASEVLQNSDANICIVCTSTALKDCYGPLEVAISHGLYCVTLSEEALYPWTTARQYADCLDLMAKQHGVALIGSGANDILLSTLSQVITGVAHKVDELSVSIQYDLSENRRLMSAHGVNLSLDAFHRQHAAISDYHYTRPVTEWLCAKLNLDVREFTQNYSPIVSQNTVRGRVEQVTAYTEQDIKITCKCIGKVYTDNDYDFYAWNILGSPNISVEMPEPDHIGTTLASVVNRLPQLLKQNPGYITTDRFPAPAFQVDMGQDVMSRP